MNRIDKQLGHGGILLLLCIFLASPAGWADSVVVVNEIMYHPAEGAPEWIELYNQMGIDIDLSGWSLEGAVDYGFPDWNHPSLRLLSGDRFGSGGVADAGRA